MAESKYPNYNAIIIILLIINLIVTSAVAVKIFETTNINDKISDISEEKANSLTSELVTLFNKKDTANLYSKFIPIARTEFSQKSLRKEIEKLHSLFGVIEETVFLHSKLLEHSGKKKYSKLTYKFRSKGATFSSGEIDITILDDGSDELKLYGFFMRGKTMAQ